MDNNLKHYCTASEAAEIISKNSGREIPADYIRTLARYGSLSKMKVSHSLSLYNRAEVNAYRAEERGAKLLRSRKAENTPSQADSERAADSL